MRPGEIDDIIDHMNLRKLTREAILASGGERALARKLKISRQAIWRWDSIPIKRLLDVERASGIPREELRPDIFRKS